MQEVGGRLQQLVQEQGVAFYMGDSVQEVKGDGADKVEEVCFKWGGGGGEEVHIQRVIV